jgi:hypothetical protein
MHSASSTGSGEERPTGGVHVTSAPAAVARVLEQSIHERLRRNATRRRTEALGILGEGGGLGGLSRAASRAASRPRSGAASVRSMGRADSTVSGGLQVRGRSHPRLPLPSLLELKSVGAGLPSSPRHPSPASS